VGRQGHWMMMCPWHRAGMVYSGGLRRCLIIFAPHTLILDRRTRTCRTPLPPLALQRSKNFTSGVAMPCTPSGPIEAETVPRPRVPGGSSPEGLGSPEGPAGGQHHVCPGRAPRPAQRYSHISGRCFAIPWTGIQPYGRFEHTGFSTVTSVGGLRWWAMGDA